MAAEAPRWRWGAALAFAAWVAAPAIAGADFVLYLHTFGDWSVVCSGDLVSDAKSCRIAAPPPVMTPAEPPSVVTVAEKEAGRFEVSVAVRGAAARGSRVSLRVGRNAPQRGRLDDSFHAAWRGDEAGALVGAFERGGKLVLRSVSAFGSPRDETYSLEGFAEALAAYRAQRRVLGIVPE